MAPDMTIGWLATTPTGRLSTRANAVISRGALIADLEHVAVVEDPQQNVVHVVSLVVGIGHDGVEFEVAGRQLRLPRPGLTIGASSQVLAGRNDR